MKKQANMSKITQRYSQIVFCSKLKQQKCHEIKKILRIKSAKYKPKKKQPANLQNTPKSMKKEAQIYWKTARLATLVHNVVGYWEISMLQ